MGVLSEMQHKDILFLFAISQELIVRAEEEGFSVSDYISKISKKDNVEVRELTIDTLASVNEFKFVIILAHHDYGTDSLLLENGTYLSLNVLVSMLPNNLKRDVVLDFAVCRTHDDKKKVNLTDEIKKINAHYYVQTAEEETDLKTRLKVYRLLPTVLKVRPETNYHQAYLFCLNELKSRRQSVKVRPSTTKLGGTESSEDVKTTVYSPLRVVRGERFNIWIAMHFDADKGTLFIDERNNDPRLKDVKARKHNVVLNNVHYDDELSIKISFEDGNDNPTELISVTNNNPKSFRLSDKIVPLKFRVFVDTGYPYDYFTAILEYIKDGHCLKKFDNLIYGFESVYPQYDTKQGRLQINIGGDKSYQTKDPGAFNITSNKEGSAEILTYKQSPNDTIFHDAIDVEKVKKVLPTFKLKTVVTGIKYWFVVHKVLEEIHWLQKKQDTLFIQWVKDVYGWEWKTEDFKSVNKAFKYKDNCREELLSIHWSAATTKDGKTGIAYKKLSDDIRKELVTIKEDGTIEDKTYFLKKDRYLFHPQKLV